MNRALMTSQFYFIAVSFLFAVVVLLSQTAFAQNTSNFCQASGTVYKDKLLENICNHYLNSNKDSNAKPNTDLMNQYLKLQDTFLATQLISNAPLQLINQHHQLWKNYVMACNKASCLKQHFESRQTELLNTISMNHSLNQHYFLVGEHDVHLQLQQLEKNRIKIEAIKLQNPQQDLKQNISLRAYSSINQLEKITDLDTQCQYQIKRMKYALQIDTTSKKKSCQHFVGLYKLYD
ncbi:MULTISPECIES: hypothetical protein [unclassified Acinetobacter]|uniref:hypothetical protein n=1 Tax=unclassified Acinetobacter TaxID=196816 RepID=UPI0035BA48B1